MLAFWFFIAGLLIGSFLNLCIYRIPRGWLKEQYGTSQAKLSLRYVLVLLFNGLIFMLVYYQTGLTPVLINYLLLSSILVVVTFIDLEHYLIPDKVLASGAILQLGVNIFTQQISFFNAASGFFTGGGLFFLIALGSRGGLGGGDIKLAAMLGLFLGWQKVLLALFIAALLGAVAGVFQIALKRKGLKDVIPFGPYLSLGAMISLLWGQQLVTWFLG